MTHDRTCGSENKAAASLNTPWDALYSGLSREGGGAWSCSPLFYRHLPLHVPCDSCASEDTNDDDRQVILSHTVSSQAKLEGKSQSLGGDYTPD